MEHKTASYLTPSLKDILLGEEILSTSVTGGSWDGSVSDTGGNWGGTDEDDSKYGL